MTTMAEENDERKPSNKVAMGRNSSGNKSFTGGSHKCRMACCGFCVVGTVVVALILVVLALTVFKVRGPKMRVNSITIHPFTTPSSSSKVTVIVDVSVKNPNPVTYYFRDSKTSFYYNNFLLGVSIWSQGKVSPRKTYRSNVTLEVPESELLKMLIEGGGLSKDAVAIDGATKVGGHVKILGLVKHHVDVAMNCTVKVGVVNFTIVDQSCSQRVWI